MARRGSIDTQAFLADLRLNHRAGKWRRDVLPPRSSRHTRITVRPDTCRDPPELQCAEYPTRLRNPHGLPLPIQRHAPDRRALIQ